MLIDWFTVAAQAINFLILVWLLKRFLYRPVLDAIDAREKRVASQLEQAAAERAKAEQERAAYESKNREIGIEREQLLNAARATATDERAKMLAQARDEYEQLQKRLAGELAEQRQDLTRSLSTRLEGELLAVAERLMRDLGDSSLNDAIVAVFARRLQSLSDQDRASLRSRLAGVPSDPKANTSTGVTLRTAFDLSAEQRARIEKELSAIASGAARIRYERAPELIGGVELVANGYRLSWSVEEYLRALREHVDLTLKSTGRS